MNIQEHSLTLKCHQVPLKKCNARARAMRVHAPNAPKTAMIEITKKFPEALGREVNISANLQ